MNYFDDVKKPTARQCDAGVLLAVRTSKPSPGQTHLVPVIYPMRTCPQFLDRYFSSLACNVQLPETVPSMSASQHGVSFKIWMKALKSTSSASARQRIVSSSLVCLDNTLESPLLNILAVRACPNSFAAVLHTE